MSTIVPTPVPVLGTDLPDPSDRTTYGTRGRALWDWEVNTLVPAINQLGDAAYTNALQAQESALVSIAAANFKGSWASLSGALAVPAAVWHSGRVWALMVGLSNVATSEPGVSGDWVDVGGVKRSGDTLTGHLNAIGNAAGPQVPQAQETAMLVDTSFSLRNLLMNVRALVNQRAYVSGAATTAANQYVIDRWRVVVSGQALSWVATASVTTFTAPAGGVEQAILGARVKKTTHVLNWGGTAVATVGGVPVTKGVPFELVPGVTVWVRFSGGTFSAPQLEACARPTAEELRDPNVDELLCLHYFWRGEAYWVGQATNAGRAGAQVSFPVPMRQPPEITGWMNLVNVNFPSSAPAAWGLTRFGFTADRIASATAGDGRWSARFDASADIV